jgi:hypothetical protein
MNEKARTLVLNLGKLELHRWWANGDHPDDRVGEAMTSYDEAHAGAIRQEGAIVRYYRHPSVESYSSCTRCGFYFHNHGWIDSGKSGRVVCPGDWIATPAPGQNFAIPNDLVEAVASFSLDLALMGAKEAVDAIPIAVKGSYLQGLVHSASWALKAALEDVDG